MHDLLETIIAQAATLTDQGALRSIVGIVERHHGAHRADLWRNFEEKSGRRIRHLVPELHRVFDLVQADKLNPKSDAFDAKAYGEDRIAARERDTSASMEGEPQAMGKGQRRTVGGEP